MRKGVVLFTLTLLFFNAFSQQRPHYSQYLQNMSVLNPAVTGTYDNIDARLGVRSQWQGFSGAPKTGYITISTPVSFTCNMDNYRDNAMGVVEPETKEDMINYSSSMSHHSLGAVFLSDKAGPLSRVTANLTYAYHISIGQVTNLSVGIGVGVNRLGIDGASLVFDEKDDAVVGSSSQINKYTPDLNAGVYYYGANFYIGASMQQIIKNRMTFDGDFSVGKEVPHYFIAAGYQFWIDNDFSFTPSVMLKAVDPLPKAFDVNMKFAYRNNFWVGGGYRKDDAFFGNVGFNVSKMVGINYAYDFTTSALRTSSSGSHELALRVLF